MAGRRRLEPAFSTPLTDSRLEGELGYTYKGFLWNSNPLIVRT